jgi:hypothetical protein
MSTSRSTERASTGASMSAAKRMFLSRDQRAVLETVYAMEKLPDADLRERLSAYLNLSTRQVQVWFQNRRQRAKAHGPKKGVLSTPDQIMEALLEFPAGSAAQFGRVPMPRLGTSGDELSDGGEEGADSGSGPEAEAVDGFGGHDTPFGESVEEGVVAAPSLSAAERALHASLLEPGALTDELFDLALPAAHTSPPFESSTTVDPWSPPPQPEAPLRSPGDGATEALLGFACHALKLVACEYWEMWTSAAGGMETALRFTHTMGECLFRSPTGRIA